MCDPVTAAVVMGGLQVATAVQNYNSQKAVAAAKEKANEQTRRNSDQAYLYDLSVIDNEVVSAAREKKLEEFKLAQEANKKQSTGLNLNAGNPDRIIQDIAGTQDLAFLDIVNDYEVDIKKAYGKTKEAYAAQQRRYNSIAPVMMPSKTGLFLQVATATTGAYQNVEKAKSAKV